MKKIGVRLLAAAVTSSMIVTPVMAAPSVDELKEKKEAAQNEVNSLQEELNDVVSELNQIELDLISVGEEISQKEEELAEAEEVEKQQYEDMKLRIKFMYEEGNSSVIESLVGSEDFTDLINNAEYVQNVHSYDRQKLAEYVETKEKIADLKSDLEEEQTKIENKEEEYQKKSDNLDTLIESKAAEVEDLDEQLQEAAAEAERKRQEEERQRQEEARRQEEAQQSTSSSSSGGSSSSSSSSGSSSSSSSSGSSSSSSSSSSSVVSRAYSQLGKPYEWGAVGPNSFDCSGFVSYCLTGSYTRIGTAATFYSWPRVSDPQPGDVCVRSGHCGIYIGNGQMIHAPHTGDVVKIGPVQSGMVYVRR